MSEMTVALRLLLDGRNFDGGVVNSGRGLTRFGALARREINSLRSAWNSTQGQLAKAGLGFGGYAVLRESARLDQNLTRIKQTAGATREQARGLRKDLFDMSRESGREIAGLREGFNSLVASGLKWDQARSTIKAINQASVVTGADEGVLASAVTVGATAFNADLGKPGVATQMLEQMTVAGRLGKIELEGLSTVFSRIGVDAKSANFSFAETLALIEQLSNTEAAPELNATLVKSTLRLFTNEAYKKVASKATGVAFYNPDGSSRKPFDVLDDISAKYQSLRTDQDRNKFFSRAFGQTDLDTQKGIRALFSEGALGQARSFSSTISGAAETFRRDLAEAMDNAVNQAGRVRSIFSKVGDDLARPINRKFADLVDKAVRPKSEGGYELSGGQMIGLGVGGVVAGTLAKRAATALLRRIPIVGSALGDTASTAAGVAQGKALQAAAGVTPVFVTNWPGSTPASGPAAAAETALAAAGGAGMLRVLPGALSGLIAANGLALTAGAALTGGALGYGAGTLINAGISGGLSWLQGRDQSLGTLLYELFNKDKNSSSDSSTSDLGGTLKIEIDNSGTVRLRGLRSNSSLLDFDVSSGPLALGPAP